MQHFSKSVLSENNLPINHSRNKMIFRQCIVKRKTRIRELSEAPILWYSVIYLFIFSLPTSAPYFSSNILPPFLTSGSALAMSRFHSKNCHAVSLASHLIVFPNQYLLSVVTAQLTVGRCKHPQTWIYKISPVYQSLPPPIETCQQNTQINQLCFRQTPASMCSA